MRFLPFLIAAAATAVFLFVAFSNGPEQKIVKPPQKIQKEQLILVATGNLNCPGSLDITITNLRTTDAPSSELKFMLDGSEISCSLPPLIPSRQSANCTVPTTSKEHQMVEVLTSSKELAYGIYFNCPVTVVRQNFSALSVITFQEKDNTSLYPEELDKFQKWADARGIFLEGINKSSNDVYFHGYDRSADGIALKDVPGVVIAAEALYNISDSVLHVMKGKTFYFSVKTGRSYTVLSSSPESNILKGANRGVILEQPVRAITVIHELGHIVDYHGIQGIYGDKQNIFSSSKQARDRIFNVSVAYNLSATAPPGHISAYSTANDAENLAEHFAYYVLRGNEFRDKMKNDTLLSEKYGFFKNIIFNEREY